MKFRVQLIRFFCAAQRSGRDTAAGRCAKSPDWGERSVLQRRRRTPPAKFTNGSSHPHPRDPSIAIRGTAGHITTQASEKMLHLGRTRKKSLLYNWLSHNQLQAWAQRSTLRSRARVHSARPWIGARARGRPLIFPFHPHHPSFVCFPFIFMPLRVLRGKKL